MNGPPPIAETLAGYLIVYVLFPLAVLGTVAIAATMFRFNRRLNTQDKALALLIEDINPPNDISLRQLMRAVELTANTTSSDLKAHVQLGEDRWDMVRPPHNNNPGGTT